MYTPTVKGVKVQARGIFLKIITELKKKKPSSIKLCHEWSQGKFSGIKYIQSVVHPSALSISRTHHPKQTLYLLNNNFSSPPPPPHCCSDLYFTFHLYEFTLGTPYKWKYTVMCFFDWLIHLTKMNVACVRFWFLLKAEEYSTYTHTPLVLSFAFPNC